LGIAVQSRAQETLPYLVGTSTHLELIGFPVHSPALDAGKVSSVVGTLVGWSPSFTERPFGSALRAGQEYYAEVVGPTGHAWLGHRFEIDETATRARTDHGLVIAASSFNTRGLPNGKLVVAQLEVRPHLTLDGLWGNTIRNRILYGGEPASGFSFSIPAPETTSGQRAITPSLPRSGDALEWLNRSFSPPTRVAQPLLIPPGFSVAVTFGQRHGSSLGLTGEMRTWPTATPLLVGINLLAYPYPKDLRLGVDWGSSREGFFGTLKPFPGQDRIELLVGKRRFAYAPEIQLSGGLRWRLLHPLNISRQWAEPAAYLDRIPPGHGFLLRKTKPDCSHFFYPPQS